MPNRAMKDSVYEAYQQMHTGRPYVQSDTEYYWLVRSALYQRYHPRIPLTYYDVLPRIAVVVHRNKDHRLGELAKDLVKALMV